MALAAQAKLLRVLQEGTVEPLGGADPVPVDVRVLAATHRDLKALAAEGRFREDLLFRLRVVEIELPPLRERDGDVLLLARHFLAASPRGLTLAPETERALLTYSWPGNVRELANAIERAAIFCRGTVVQPEDLPQEVRGTRSENGGLAFRLAAGRGLPGRQEKTDRSLRARHPHPGPRGPRRQHLPSRQEPRPPPPEPPAEAPGAGDRGRRLPGGVGSSPRDLTPAPLLKERGSGLSGSPSPLSFRRGAGVRSPRHIGRTPLDTPH